MAESTFEWDDAKNAVNIEKHGVAFEDAQRAFLDPKRVILKDVGHSEAEDRFFCIGCVDDGVMTVRFTYRTPKIRIFGAGYWRKGKQIYETRNQIH